MAKREFNKAEALRRYRAGEKVTDIAADMDIAKTDVYSAIRELKRAEEWAAVKTSGSGAAESKAVPPDDNVSGADNISTPPEDTKPSAGVSVCDTILERSYNKNIKNKDIRKAAKKQGVRLWEIAEKLDRCELSVSRGLRTELSDWQKVRMINIINQISAEKKEGKPISKLYNEFDVIFRQGRQEKEEKPLNVSDIQAAVMCNTSDDREDCKDFEGYPESPEAWVARKANKNSSPEPYFVKLKDGTELIINGVTKVLDGWNKIIFAGNTGKAVVVSAAELVYYLPKDSEDVFGEISVE